MPVARDGFDRVAPRNGASLHRVWTTAGWIASVIVMLTGTALAESQSRVEGTDVVLSVPDGFQPMDRYPGYQDPESGASILVSEIPGSVETVTAGFTAEGLASQGMILVQTETLSILGHEGRLISASQSAHSIDWLKWIVISGDSEKTTLVVATYPEAQREQFAEVLRAAVLSAQPAATPAGIGDGLLFTIEETAELVIVHRMGNLLLLGPPGSEIPIPSSSPVLVVGSSIASVSLDNLATFAERRAHQIEQVHDLEVLDGRELSVDGLPAYELIGRGLDPETGESIGVYELVLSEGGNYHLAVGLVKSEAFDRYLGAFREAAESLRLK